MKTEIKSFITKYYLISFFSGLNFFSPFFVIFLNSIKLSPLQITIAIISAQISQFVFELPTGAIADRFSRKLSVLLGSVMFLIALLFFLFADCFLMIVIGEIFCGIALSLNSGAFDALVYDNMKHFKIENKFAEYRGMSWALKLAAISLSAFCASFIIENGFSFLIIASILFVVIHGSILLTLKEYGMDNIRKINKNYTKLVKQTFSYLFKHNLLLKFSLFWGIAIGFIFIGLNFREFFILEITYSKSLTAKLVVIMTISGALGRAYFIKFLSNKHIKYSLYLLLFITFVFPIAFILYSFPASFIIFVFYWTCLGSCTGMLGAKNHQFTPSRYRASLESLTSMLQSIMVVLYLFVFGIIGNNFGYKAAFIWYSVIQLFVVIVFSYLLLKDKHLIKKENASIRN